MRRAWKELLMTLVASAALARGGEPMAVTGYVERAPVGQFLSSHFLRDPEKRGLVAGLRDPHNMLLTANGPMTLQVEKAAFPDVNGLPVLKVMSVSPQFFAQPSAWKWQHRGPSAFSGFGKDLQPKDFAGKPFTMQRAYAWDNGLQSRRLDVPSEAELPEPTRILSVAAGAEAVIGEFTAQAGLTYEVHFADSLGDVPSAVDVVTPTVSGPTPFTAPKGSAGMGFYLIRAVAPSSL